MQHDPAPAIDFLRKLRPAGPWLLIAIAVDQLGIDGRTLVDDDGVAAFLRAHPKRNVYFSLNPTTRPLAKKPERVDIAQIEYLHVDLDPRPDLDSKTDEQRARHFVEERVRILKRLDEPPSPIPGPTAIIFSGGGYQGLWGLADPLAIAGETDEQRIASAEDAKRYNLQLEWAFGGDHCHNVDRILRLPGTLNFPDEKKRAKGRTAIVRAELVRWSDEKIPLARFTPAPLVQSRTSSSTAGGRRRAAPVVGSPGNVQRYNTEELHAKWPNVNKRAWVIAVQGHDPDDKERHDGRSEWLFYAVCEMVRGGVPDEVIYSVITDPDMLVSASVLDKGSSSERYALRQIERAKERAIDPALAELNDQHWVVQNYGGKCRVMEELHDPNLNRSMLTIQSFADFRNRYMNRIVEIGQDRKGNPITMPMGDWWLKHEQRRQYRSVVFSPEREIPGAYNLWQGFAVEPRPGERHRAFLQHIKHNLCNDDERIYNYLVRWMAMAVQHPGRPGEVAIVLRGEPGTGKGTFAKIFGSLFGRHFLHVSNAVHLVGQFNAQLRDAVVVFADEAFFAGDKKHESVLKTMITEEMMQSERKGIDSEQAANFIHLIMASNSKWVVPAGTNERRYLVLDVSTSHMQDTAYFATLRKQLDDDDRLGLSNLLYYLQTLDLAGFDVRTAPQTAALREQKIMSMESAQEWWFRKLEEGILLPNHAEWTLPVIKERLVDDYLMYATRVGNRRSTATMLGRFLREVCPGVSSFQGWAEIDDQGPRRRERRHFWELPALERCRKAFEQRYLGEYPWEEITMRGSTPLTDEEPF